MDIKQCIIVILHFYIKTTFISLIRDLHFYNSQDKCSAIKWNCSSLLFKIGDTKPRVFWIFLNRYSLFTRIISKINEELFRRLFLLHRFGLLVNWARFEQSTFRENYPVPVIVIAKLLSVVNDGLLKFPKESYAFWNAATGPLRYLDVAAAVILHSYLLLTAGFVAIPASFLIKNL